MSGIWLPEGHHYDLHIEHRPMENAGERMATDDPKWVWHTTESPWFSVDAMADTLQAKRAAPQLLIGGRPRVKHPVVIQLTPLELAGRSLANDTSDGFQTNRDNVTQCEICWTASLAHLLTLWHYKALANLVRLTNIALADRNEVPPVLARRFVNTKRMTDQEFANATGHLGHMHVPDNDHTDPGFGFKGSVLMGLLNDQFPKGGWRL